MRIGRRASGVDIGIGGISGASLIGQGGFGVVYRAEHRALDRTVAVKILSAPGFDDDTRRRFERECDAIEALAGHGHVVPILDSGINAWGRPFIVMEYMARGSVAERIAAAGPLTWPVAIDIGISIASAVAASHAAGILHRDIKPQNVLLSAYDEPKLGDFGIASLAAEQTNSGSVAASLEHAAPELLNGDSATQATDVYALASTVYTMLAGASPFARRTGEALPGLVARIMTEDVPDLRPQGVPGALCDVLERGLAKDPAERFSSADEFAAALVEIQEHHGLEPTAASAVPTRSVVSTTGGLTGPTRPRLRREPTVSSPQKRPGRGRIIAAAAIALLVAAAGTSVAVMRDRTRPSEELASRVVSNVVTPAEEEVPDRVKGARHERRRARHDRNAKTQRKTDNNPSKVAYGSGTTIAAPPAQGPANSGGSSNQRARNGSKEQPPKPPPAPPAPDLTLYHAFKGSDHANYTDPNLRTGFQERGFTIEVVGGVYSYEADRSKPITVNGTTLYVFAYGTGSTKPATSRLELYYMTSTESDDFYTSDEGTRHIYYGRGWNGQRLGWVAS